MTLVNFYIEDNVKVNTDSFYSVENIAELERRVANIKNSISTLKEHELIDVDDE